MSMVVMERVQGLHGLGNSRTMVYPPNRARVAAAQRAAGNWAQATPLRGLGMLDRVPTWAWWLAGGVVAGGAAYWLLKK